MKFLGCVVLSFGFRIYEQRKLVKRHAVEILGTMLSSAFFSLAVTLLVGRAMVRLRVEPASQPAPLLLVGWEQRRGRRLEHERMGFSW